MTDKDGGPAFPVRTIVSYVNDPDGSIKPVYSDSNGMSLRDWFAGQALAGIIRNGILEDFEPEVAARAYRFADAMLAERDA